MCETFLSRSGYQIGNLRCHQYYLAEWETTEPTFTNVT